MLGTHIQRELQMAEQSQDTGRSGLCSPGEQSCDAHLHVEKSLDENVGEFQYSLAETSADGDRCGVVSQEPLTRTLGGHGVKEVEGVVQNFQGGSSVAKSPSGTWGGDVDEGSMFASLYAAGKQQGLQNPPESSDLEDGLVTAFAGLTRTVPQKPLETAGSFGALSGLDMMSAATSQAPTRFLWIGNLTSKVTRPMLCTIFERFGLLEDLVAFPGRMYAFVTYQHTESAIQAVQAVQGVMIRDVTGDKGMVVKYRPERKVSMHASDASRDGSSGLASSGSEVDVEPSPRIWLGNIAPTATAANLQSVLGRFGPLVDAAVFPARIGPLGYAFVKFERIEDAINAYNTLNNAVVPALSGTKQVKMRYKPVSEGAPVRDTALDALQASIPSRHIWIGNVTQKPTEDILIRIFSRFGTIESARVFSAKSYAFVNFHDVSSAIEAITKLDGVSVPVLTGLKPLVMRYQHDGNIPNSSASNVHLNSKVLELLARSRMVPDAHQSFLNPVGIQIGTGAGMGQVFSPHMDSNSQAPYNDQVRYIGDSSFGSEASKISAMLQNLAALAPPSAPTFTGLPTQEQSQPDFQSHLNQNLWMHEGQPSWAPKANSLQPLNHACVENNGSVPQSGKHPWTDGQL
jgi:RNA recognition motif-containing protein